MSLRLGDVAPDFTADSTEGKINFHEFIEGSWAVLFSHPSDFTPVCTTELGRVAQLKSEFDKRNTKVIALSVDPLDSHQGWVKDINETQATTLNYPILADVDGKIAQLYDMLHPNSDSKAAVRAVFVIGPDKKIKLTLTYPPSTGRNFDELLRVIDSLQLTAYHLVATPADWKQGEDVVVLPSVPASELESRFPSGVRIVKPYLRYTKAPA